MPGPARTPDRPARKLAVSRPPTCDNEQASSPLPCLGVLGLICKSSVLRIPDIARRSGGGVDDPASRPMLHLTAARQSFVIGMRHQNQHASAAPHRSGNQSAKCAGCAITLNHPAAKFAELIGILRRTSVIGPHASRIGRVAEGHRHVEFIKRAHHGDRTTLPRRAASYRTSSSPCANI